MESRLVLPVGTLLDGSYRIARVVGSGGFGITYEAEDVNLATMVAVKEYYPHDFGDRDGTMSVRARSERHRETFDWGRANFLQEARTLARFEHPSIVRVTRVFEAHSTAYMVMRFEKGESLERWLKNLGRPPTQEELDSIAGPLLDALQVLHASKFLHRDIAPDNIIIRPDGSPVLLDFGSARRAVAEMSRALTGIVKAGYSPHEQYSSDGRLQGPWSDIYALGGTLYRAVTGKPPEEATMRFDRDPMAPAARGAKGTYRPAFLKAIDSCLKVRQSERPQSVAQLRPMLLGTKAPQRATDRLGEPRRTPTALLPDPREPLRIPQVAKHWPIVAAVILVIGGGALSGYGYHRWSVSANNAPPNAEQLASEAARRRAAEAAAQAQAAMEAERRQREKEAADARQRQAEADEIKRRQDEEARRKADEDRRNEERRIAALETARQQEAKRQEDERLRLAAIPDDDKRAELVRKVQLVLKRNRCYDGALSGNSADAQDGVDRFVTNANKRGHSKVARIELAKSTVGDFETWLKGTEEIKGAVCAVAAKPAPQQQQRPASRPSRPSAGGSVIQGIQ